jgi:hypothetical protein
MATLTVGTAIRAPGQEISLPIHLDTLGVLVRGIQVNIAFDPTPFTIVSCRLNLSIPPTWIFSSNLPSAGDLRFGALDPTGAGLPFNGTVFFVHFFISNNATPQTVAINVALQDIRDANSIVLPVIVTNGLVTVTTTILISNPAVLTVTHPTPVSLAILPTTASLQRGASQQYTAVCTLQDGSTLICTDHVQWISSAPEVATIGPTGLATGMSAGEAHITAQLTDPVLP